MFNRHLKQRIADLELHLKNATELSKHKSFEIAKLKDKIDSLKRDIEVRNRKEAPTKGERLVGIKFKALFDGLYQPTAFKTGPGPCGKDVKWFTVDDDDRNLIIHQLHTDGSRKDFVYRKSDIDGRIQYDYEMVELTGKEAADERDAKLVARAWRRGIRPI